MQPQRITSACLTCSAPLQWPNTKYCSRTCDLADPNHTRYTRRPLLERFWDRVEKTDTCWIWQGPTSSGYGVIGKGGAHNKGAHELYTHRLAWELASGSPPPRGLMVLHACDVRHCVRHDDKGVYTIDGVDLPRYGHLFLGTAAQNMRDMRIKGRWRVTHPLIGERNHAHKLTEAMVREIRAALGAPDRNKSVLARRYGVTPRVITLIDRGEMWSHVR